MLTVKELEIPGIVHAFYDATDYEQAPNPFLMTQVHSADVLVVEENTPPFPHVDALVTRERGICLTVKTADCGPVLLADEQAGVVAAVHAGWKGAFQGVIENTILKMIELGAEPKRIVAGIGPHLQRDSFEVDQTMKALFPATEDYFFTPLTNDRFLFDFQSYLEHRLRRAGVEKIGSIVIDTYTDNNYFSYRRDPKNPGRQYSCILIK